MFFRMVYKSGPIFLPFCQGSRVWRTDRRTDRQTDGRTEFSSLYRVCITCSAVKIVNHVSCRGGEQYICTPHGRFRERVRRGHWVGWWL